MIYSYVVHLVVGVQAEERLVGFIEDVETGERYPFTGVDELAAALTRRSPEPPAAPAPVPSGDG